MQKFIHRKPKPRPERSFRPPVTVPGHAMEVPEILERFAKGLPLTGVRVPLPSSEPLDEDDPLYDLPDMTRLDKTERIDAVRAAQSLHKDVTGKIREDRKKKHKADQDALDAFKKAQNEPKPDPKDQDSTNKP